MKIPEYSDFSKSDVGIVLIELLSHGLDINAYYNDVVANEVFMDTAQRRSSVISLARQIGYEVENARASKFLQVFEIKPQSLNYTIPKGTVITTKGTIGEEEVVFELAENLLIPAGKIGNEKDEEDNYIYAGSVEHGLTINEEVLGTSRDVPDQSFKLNYAKALKDSLILYVNDGTTWEIWNRVDSFIDSEGFSKDYMIQVNDLDEMTVIFGNGLSGKIPPKVINGIVATYRVGGGIEGNVAPNKITEMPQKLAVINKTYNPYEPYILGMNKESNDVVKLRSTAQLRTLWRAVTIYDFEDLAYELDFTHKVKAIENKVDRVVEVYVLPTSKKELSALEVKELQELYNERKLLYVDVAILSPIVKEIELHLDIKVLANFTQTEVEKSVRDYLVDRVMVDNYDIGQEFNLSEIVGEVIQINGVRSVGFISPEDDIEIEENEIITLSNLVLNMVGGIIE